jgi:hypothetical protein
LGVGVSFAVLMGACQPRPGPGGPTPVPPVADVPTGPFTPGQSYFGRNQYVEYIAGNAPVIFAAPHGGVVAPDEIPARTCGTTVRDSNTEELARALSTTFFARTGKYPHIIINRLARSRFDANRDLAEAACGNAAAAVAWEEWHALIDTAKASAIASSGRAWFVDLHGHGHAIQRLELGYLLTNANLDLPDAQLNGLEGSSSVRSLSQDDTSTTFAQLMRGAESLGALFAAEGFRSIPSPADPSPSGADYFDGGYNTQRHGCAASGRVCGVQIEANLAGVRDTEANRARFAEAIVKVTRAFLGARWGMTI